MTRLHPAALIAMISVIVATGAISIDMYTPSMPSMAARLETGPAMVQMTMSAFLLGYALAQLVCGPLSDRFGRRPTLIGGCAIYIGASIACAYATSIETLIALRLIQSLGACAGPVIGRAIIRDLYGVEDSARAFAYVGMVMMLTPILAPILGAWLEVTFGWRSNFVFMAAFAGIMLAAVMALLWETNPNPDMAALRPARLAGNYVTLLADRNFMGYALSIGFAMGGVFAFVTASAFVLIGLAGVSPQTFSLLFALTAAAYAAGSFASTRLVPKWGLNHTILAGVLSFAGGALAMAGLSLASVFGVASICAPMVLVSFGNGLIVPNCQAGAFASYPHMAGTASALNGFVMMAAAGSVGGAVAQLYDGTARPMVFAIMLCGMALSAVFYFLVWRRHGAAEVA